MSPMQKDDTFRDVREIARDQFFADQLKGATWEAALDAYLDAVEAAYLLIFGRVK